MDLDLLRRDWDGECLVARYDRPTGAWILIAVHSTRLGPASGGTRMKVYADPSSAISDALRLSEAMTFKYAAANFPQGGAKAVIALPEGFDPSLRPDLLRRYGQLIRQLGGLYSTGPDVGTSPADMDVIAETGAPFVHARTPAAGGRGDSGRPTAVGVLSGIQATIEHLDGTASLRGKRILVQGAGGVGGALIELLIAEGADVTFSEVSEAATARLQAQGLIAVAPEQVFDTPCDIFSPCALGGVLNRDTIPRLRCRAVAGGANLQLAEPADLDLLQARGILYAPDFVVNIGGAMAITGMESFGWTAEEADRRVREVRTTLKRVYEMAAALSISTDAAARRIARENLEKASTQPEEQNQA